MNHFELSARTTSNQREGDQKCASDFHAVLLGMAGHDLRQPLQAIQSTYDLLGSRLVNAPERAWLQRGERAITRLTEQLDRLVGALRLTELTTSMELAPVPLGPLLDSLHGENAELARKNGIDLRVCPTRSVVISNTVLLDGIVRNLVHNAIKYTPASGRVLIGCRRRGPDVRIDIHDTGIGMAADQMPRIFDAFQRLDSNRREGLGLGLFVVRRAVQLLGHRIEVRSAIGRGSRFSVIAKSHERNCR